MTHPTLEDEQYFETYVTIRRDKLAQLEAEVERLQETIDDVRATNRKIEKARVEWVQEARKHEAEVERLNDEIIEMRNLWGRDQRRAEKAEAEVERLKRNHNEIVVPMVHHLKTEVGRLRAIEEAAKNLSDRVLGMTTVVYVPLREEAEALRAALAEEKE